MKYVSIDIETTGLDPETCQILEIGAVIDDLENPKPVVELPCYHKFFWHTKIHGEPFALSLNARIIKWLAENSYESKDCVTSSSFYVNFITWLESHYDDLFVDGQRRINVAGKNFNGFDKRFLERLKNADALLFHHRVLDPGPLYCLPEDKVVPNLNLCLKRAGLSSDVTHCALDDAVLVVKLIRKLFGLPM